jgi:hypothetical protein
MTLDQVRQFAMSLQDVTEEPHFEYMSFRIGMIFATAPPGGEYLHIFLDEAERMSALERYPDFLEELFWGKRAIGVRVLLSAAKAEVIRTLVETAYSAKAAKRTKARRRKKA